MIRFFFLYNHFMPLNLSEQVTESMGLQLSGIWPSEPLVTLAQACTDFCEAFGITPPLHQLWLRKIRVCLQELAYGGLTSPGFIRLNPEGLTTWTVVHELGHAWDYAAWGTLSLRMMLFTRSGGPFPILHALQPMEKSYWYKVGSPPPPCGVDQNFNRLEDFAEAVAAYVYPKDACQKAIVRGYPYGHYGYVHFRQTPRGKFIAGLVSSLQLKEMALTS
jgi:hypothetical protein